MAGETSSKPSGILPKQVLAFSRASSNYALRHLGNDTRCAPRRSACSSLEAFDASMKLGDAASMRPTELAPARAPPCHLDFGDEDRRLSTCALSKPESILKSNLAFLKATVGVRSFLG